jgi:hypothetical protein
MAARSAFFWRDSLWSRARAIRAGAQLWVERPRGARAQVR